jgi:hypothetical protein
MRAARLEALGSVESRLALEDLLRTLMLMLVEEKMF